MTSPASVHTARMETDSAAHKEHRHHLLPSSHAEKQQSSGEPLDFMRIIPLASPKNVKLQCELCGKLARLVCSKCNLTFYCTAHHQETDYRSIHAKICNILLLLRKEIEIFGSEEERTVRSNEMHALRLRLLDITKTEAHKKLYEGQFELAIPAALQALKVSIDIYGKDSIELVSTYLLLGEASIGLSHYNQSEEYLSLAKWGLLKSCSNASPELITPMNAQLYRNFGLLYQSKGSLDKALGCFAQVVYLNSLVYGESNVRVAGSFFQLADLFQKQNRDQHVEAVYEKIISIFSSYLQGLETGNNENDLDEVQQAEARQILLTMQSYYEDKSHSSSSSYPLSPEPTYATKLSTIEFTLAKVLLYVCKNPTESREVAKKAVLELERCGLTEKACVVNEWMRKCLETGG